MQSGDRVDRLEEREVTGATVLEVVETGDGPIARLAYDEGGEGWWPLDCLAAAG